MLDGIERQLTRGKGAKGKKSRSDNKLSSDANRRGINAKTGSASKICGSTGIAMRVSRQCHSTYRGAERIAAMQADFQQLQTTVGALAEQMSWFVERLKEDDDSEMTDAGIVEPIASASSAHTGQAPDEISRENEVMVLMGLAVLQRARMSRPTLTISWLRSLGVYPQIS